MPLFKPTIYKRRLTGLTVDELKSMGVSALLLDVDNTLATHFSQQPLDGIIDFLDRMKHAGIGLFIVSNARESRVRPFAEKLQINYFSLCKKPLPFRLNKAIKSNGFEKTKLLLCGDQLFTDMLCGNLCGIKTLLVEPALPENKIGFRIKRALEKPFILRYKKLFKL